MIYRPTRDQHFLHHGPERRAWHDLIVHADYRCPYRPGTDDAEAYHRAWYDALQRLSIDPATVHLP